MDGTNFLTLNLTCYKVEILVIAWLLRFFFGGHELGHGLESLSNTHAKSGSHRNGQNQTKPDAPANR